MILINVTYDVKIQHFRSSKNLKHDLNTNFSLGLHQPSNLLRDYSASTLTNTHPKPEANKGLNN